MSLVLTDLPNFYNGLVQASALTPQETKDYFLDWLEMDLLATAINPEKRTIGTWVFYSNRAIGRGDARISPENLKQFVSRTNLCTGISVIEAGIQGQQSESFEFVCSQCGKKNVTQTRSEKGIDSTLITHLFDTMDSWEVATIISHDADYCPAIRALRRRGKVIFGAGFPKWASEALITECFGFIDVMQEYLERDMGLFTLFKRKGKLSQLIIKANKIKGIEMSCWIAKSSREERKGLWQLSIRGDKDNRNNPNLKDKFRSDVIDIKHDFPFVEVGGDRGFNYFEQLEIKLDDYQLECLKRKSKSYIEFNVSVEKLIDLSHILRRW